ncbi:kinase-like domain-containing protein [Suillus subluteus]|nr:kinase-like domain-containing protein [Suillus subluteus]
MSDLLAYFGLVVKLPLTFIRWSYREIVPTTLHSFAQGSCPNPQGAVPSPVISEPWTLLREGHNIDVPEYTNCFPQSLLAEFQNSSIDSSLDSSRRTPTTPANFQRHPVGESQCNSPPDLTSQVVRREIYPTLSGTYSDVWRSTWNDDKRKRDVAVKSLKIPFSNEDEKSKNCQNLMGKISRWVQLHHKNVLPLYGIAHDFGHFPSLVTPWVDEGSLNDHIANHHLSLRSKLEIAKQVVAGLGYQIPTPAQPSGGVRSAVRWTDPQLFEVQKAEIDPCIPTEQTDIYSMGSILLQLLTGSIPYYDIKDNIRVLILSSTGVKPKCPPETFVTSAQWGFIQRCWSPRGLSSRPTIGEIEEFLGSELRMAGLP